VYHKGIVPQCLKPRHAEGVSLKVANYREGIGEVCRLCCWTPPKAIIRFDQTSDEAVKMFSQKEQKTTAPRVLKRLEGKQKVKEEWIVKAEPVDPDDAPSAAGSTDSRPKIASSGAVDDASSYKSAVKKEPQEDTAQPWWMEVPKPTSKARCASPKKDKEDKCVNSVIDVDAEADPSPKSVSGAAVSKKTTRKRSRSSLDEASCAVEETPSKLSKAKRSESSVDESSCTAAGKSSSRKAKQAKPAEVVEEVDLADDTVDDNIEQKLATKEAHLEKILSLTDWRHALEELCNNPICNTNKGQGAVEVWKKAFDHVKKLAPEEVCAKLEDYMSTQANDKDWSKNPGRNRRKFREILAASKEEPKLDAEPSNMNPELSMEEPVLDVDEPTMVTT